MSMYEATGESLAFNDLRKYMHRAPIASPALGSVTHACELERLFSGLLTGKQAALSQADLERVAFHYGQSKAFGKKVYEELKGKNLYLGTVELKRALEKHWDELDDDIQRFISQLIAFPHLYKHPNDKASVRIWSTLEEIKVCCSSVSILFVQG